jgi:hypothetical protein
MRTGPAPASKKGNALVLTDEVELPEPSSREITSWFRVEVVHKKTLYNCVHPDLVIHGSFEDTRVNIRLPAIFAETVSRLAIAFPGFKHDLPFFHYVQMVAVARRTGMKEPALDSLDLRGKLSLNEKEMGDMIGDIQHRVWSYLDTNRFATRATQKPFVDNIVNRVVRSRGTDKVPPYSELVTEYLQVATTKTKKRKRFLTQVDLDNILRA